MKYQIEFWRYLFTCMVCLLHFEVTYLGEQKIFTNCYLAVEFFFILSGFLLAKHSIEKEDSAIEYTLLKIQRFYPYLLMSWTLLLANLCFSKKWNFVELLRNIRLYIWDYLCLNALAFKWDFLNGPTWYISALIITGYFLYWMIKKNEELYIEFLAPLFILLIYSYYGYKGGIRC